VFSSMHTMEVEVEELVLLVVELSVVVLDVPVQVFVEEEVVLLSVLVPLELVVLLLVELAELVLVVDIVPVVVLVVVRASVDVVAVVRASVTVFVLLVSVLVE